jgi:hypothetical protein
MITIVYYETDSCLREFKEDNSALLSRFEIIYARSSDYAGIHIVGLPE